jgi:hypothetical protein
MRHVDGPALSENRTDPKGTPSMRSERAFVGAILRCPNRPRSARACALVGIAALAILLTACQDARPGWSAQAATGSSSAGVGEASGAGIVPALGGARSAAVVLVARPAAACRSSPAVLTLRRLWGLSRTCSVTETGRGPCVRGTTGACAQHTVSPARVLSRSTRRHVRVKTPSTGRC